MRNLGKKWWRTCPRSRHSSFTNLVTGSTSIPQSSSLRLNTEIFQCSFPSYLLLICLCVGKDRLWLWTPKASTGANCSQGKDLWDTGATSSSEKSLAAFPQDSAQYHASAGVWRKTRNVFSHLTGQGRDKTLDYIPSSEKRIRRRKKAGEGRREDEEGERVKEGRGRKLFHPSCLLSSCQGSSFSTSAQFPAW